MLAGYASSPLGKEMCLKLEPYSDLEVIEREQKNTEDAFSRLIKKENISFGSNKNVILFAFLQLLSIYLLFSKNHNILWLLLLKSIHIVLYLF